MGLCQSPYVEEVLHTAVRDSQNDHGLKFLRDHGFRAFRVRFHDASTARIELSPEDIQRVLDPALRAEIVAFMKDTGFTYVTLDLQGYRTGSMNEVLSEETRSKFSSGH